MQDDVPINPDDEREVPLEDEAEYDPPPPTVDPEERIELGETDEVLDEFEGGFEG
ncbi:hypothetical protein [Microbacterium protaetiae]|uniref:hypothetical protein n=1 Tax=Microbacterium protaetiae TaxID=2509458 RepID=UPI0013EB315D|nr:hypothetical protein [Microbacterium protaetiae]